MDYRRKLKEREENLISFLIKKANFSVPSDWKDNLLVKPMEDGKMGSLHLFPDGNTQIIDRKFGSKISEVEFVDKDDVLVSVALYVDTNFKLYELDIWKTDFSEIIEIPLVFH
jgi:hypothetical protein